MPEFRKDQCIFPHKRILYNHAYRDTPTPPRMLCSNLPLAPLTLVRPSLTALGHHALLIWQDWLNFTAFFSITAVYLETPTTSPPRVQNSLPDWGPYLILFSSPSTITLLLPPSAQFLSLYGLTIMVQSILNMPIASFPAHFLAFLMFSS